MKAGVDGFVNSIRDREVDDALIAAMKEKNVFLAPALTANEAKFIYADKPDWLGEQTMREVYPARLSGYLVDRVLVNRFKRNPELRRAIRQAYATASKNLKKLLTEASRSPSERTAVRRTPIPATSSFAK